MNLVSEGGKQSSLLEAIKDAIVGLCKASLGYEEELNIEGLLGITLDKKDVLLLNLRECYPGANTVSENEEGEGHEAHADRQLDEEEYVDPEWQPGRPQTTPKGGRGRGGRKRTRSQGAQAYRDLQKRARVQDTASPRRYPNTDGQAGGDSGGFAMPVIKIEPQDPDDDNLESLDTRRLQDEIKAARSSDTINSLSSKIVQLMQSEHLPDIRQSLQSAKVSCEC